MKKTYPVISWKLLGVLAVISLAMPVHALTKIDAMKTGVESSINISLGRNIPVGLVAFSSSPSCTNGICSHSSLSLSSTNLFAQIDGYAPMAGTCLSCGISKARDILSVAGGQKYIVVTSDGVPQSCMSMGGAVCPGDSESAAKQEALSQAALANASGIKIYTVTLGAEADPVYMKDLADRSGGKSYNVSCACPLDCVLDDIASNEVHDHLVYVNDVSGSMVIPLDLNCSATTSTTLVTTTTTTTTTASSSTTPSSTSTTTTMTPGCVLVGNTPPCNVVTVSEIISAITSWASGNMTLQQVMALISAWATGVAN